MTHVVDLNTRGFEHPASPPEFVIPHETFTLENGLVVIVHEDHTLADVTVNIWYQVGSKDEPQGRKGFAHLFEHLMFGGSQNHPGSYIKNMTNRGAWNVNGSTSKDRTNYYQTVPTSVLDYVLFAESDRMGHFIESLSQETLSAQQGVVINEKKQYEDAPYGLTDELKLRSLYPPGHPYSHPVIGFEDDIRSATLETAREWFNQYYHPANAVITLAGDITLAEAKEKIQRYFGHIPAGPVVPSISSWVPERRLDKHETFYDNVPFPKMTMSWQLPPYGEEATYHFMFLADILVGNANARLKKRLLYTEKRADNISCWVEPGLLCSLFSLSVTLNHIDDRPAVEAIINEEIARLLAEGPLTQELSLVQLSWPTYYIKSFETAASVADLLSSSKVMLGSAGGYQQLFTCLKNTRVETLQHSARDWLSNGRYTLWTLPRKIRQPTTTDESRQSIPRSGALAVPEFPLLQRRVLENGLTLTVAERRSRRLVSLNASIQFGLIHQPPALRGLLACLMELLEQSATRERSFEQLTEYLEWQGFDLSYSVDYRSMNISFNCLSTQLTDALTVLGERLFYSQLSQSDFATVKQKVKNKLIASLNTSSGIINAVKNRVMYGDGHAFDFQASLATLDALEFKDLQNFYEQYFTTGYCELVVTGDTTVDEVVCQVDAIWGMSAKPVCRPPAPAALAYPLPQSVKIYLIDKPDVEQSLIAVMQHLPGLSADSRRDFNALHAIWSNGFASRINMNLREEKNWTYGVGGIRQSWLGMNLAGMILSVQKDKTVAAMSEIVCETRRLLAHRPITDEELGQEIDSASARLGSHIARVQDLAGYIRFLAENELPDNYLLEYMEWAQTVTATRVNERAKNLIQPERFVWVVIGDLALIAELIKESGIGEVEILSTGKEKVITD